MRPNTSVGNIHRAQKSARVLSVETVGNPSPIAGVNE